MEWRMSAGRRWEDDTRGQGIADGRWIAARVARLQQELRLPTWITEAPEVHLLPWLRQACEQPESPWRLVEATSVSELFVVSLEWTRPDGSVGQLRADIFALLGQVAETMTFVEQHVEGEQLVYDVVTGMRAQAGRFAGHGHLLQFRVGGARVRALARGLQRFAGVSSE
jgi:hypothetical protein